MEDTQSGAAAPSSQGSDFIGGFAPGQPMIPEDAPLEKEPEVAAAPAAPAPEEVTPLSRLIKSQREEREARVRHERDASDAKAQLAEARAENEKLKQTTDPMSDPVGWARTHNMTKDQQALFGASLLYDTVPDKAPPDLRFKLFEAKNLRETQAAEVARRQAADTAAKSATEQQINTFVSGLGAAAKAFEAGRYPESEAWFDSDHDNYVRSLFATANNLAEAATRNGQVADLSAGNVANVLEAEMAKRQARRDAKRSGAKKPAVAPQGAAAMQAAGETMSTRGLGAGAPRGPATTDEERVRRASEVAFRTK